MAVPKNDQQLTVQFEAWLKVAGLNECTAVTRTLLEQSFAAGRAMAVPAWLDVEPLREVVHVDGVAISRALFSHLKDSANEGHMFRLVTAADASGMVTLEDLRGTIDALRRVWNAVRVDTFEGAPYDVRFEKLYDRMAQLFGEPKFDDIRNDPDFEWDKRFPDPVEIEKL